MKSEPFLAQRRFRAKKCISEPEMQIGTQNAGNEQKGHFWAQKCSFRKSDQKVNVGPRLPYREQGFPDSSPESIHGRGGQNM